MGQAKQRGSRDERIAQAKERLAESETAQDQARLEWWLRQATQIVKRLGYGTRQLAAYDVLLSFIAEHRYGGGCHDTSAVLFMLFRELGLDAQLYIGEVAAGSGRFDHSWVESDGMIFDPAVAVPQEGAPWVSGPIFASLDLDTCRSHDLEYGVESKTGLDEPALSISRQSFSEYAATQPPMNIWIVLVALANRIGIELTFAEVEQKYGSMRRTFRCGVA